MINNARATLEAGGTVIGPSIGYASSDLAEVISEMGFDFVVLDWQHGEWSEASLREGLARFLGSPTAPLVRVQSLEFSQINRVLDLGALGVVVPLIETAEQARQAVDAAMYPPLGRRSTGGARLARIAGGANYGEVANGQIMVVVMLETEAAVSRAEEIMSVPGVTAAIIGPGDLMNDLNSRGAGDRHQEVALSLITAGEKAGTAAGYVSTVNDGGARRKQGFRFVWCGSEGAALRGALTRLRDETRGE